ncbi:MAG: hypothetical protein ACYDDU_11885 [Dermatophilaceae bacterium]
MRWLLVATGATPLLILGPGLRDGWWPLGFAALVALGASVFGRWPATGTAFCLGLIAMVAAQTQLSMLAAAETAAPMGLYLLVLDAVESGLDAVRVDWAADQVVPTLSLLGGIVVVLSAEAMPLAAPVILLIAAAAAAATLLWWVGVDDR